MNRSFWKRWLTGILAITLFVIRRSVVIGLITGAFFLGAMIHEVVGVILGAVVFILCFSAFIAYVDEDI